MFTSSIRVKPCGFGLSICQSSKEDDLTIVLGSDKLEFVLSSGKEGHKRRLEKEVRKFYGEIVWQTPTKDRIRVRCIDTNRDLLNWRKDVGEVVKQFFNDIKVQSFRRHPVKENNILERRGNTSLLYKEENGRQVVVGFKTNVNKLCKSIDNICEEDVSERRVLKVRRHEAYIVHYSDITDTLQDVNIEVDLQKSELIIRGAPEDNEVAVELLLDQFSIINTFRNLSFSTGRMTLMKVDRVRDRILMKENNLNVYYEVNESSSGLSLTLYTLSEDGKDTFIAFVQTTLVEEKMAYADQHDVNDVAVACERVERQCNGETSIEIRPEYRTIILTAFKTNVQSILTDLSNLLRIESRCEVLVHFKPMTFRFLMEKFDEIKEIVYTHDCEVWERSDLLAFYFKGSEKTIEKVRDEFEVLLSKTVFKNIKFRTRCRNMEEMDKLVDAECGKTGCMFKKDPEKMIETTRNIVVYNGDATTLDVDVIAISSNQRLKMVSGLSKVVLKKGGKQLQEECDAYVKKKGPVDSGDVFICSGGKLQCLAIAHVVTCLENNDVDTTRFEQAVVRCLLRIEFQKFKSVAFPALFTNVFRCTIDTSVKTIVEAIDTYFKDNPNSNIHTVILCDQDRERTLTFLNTVKRTRWQSKVLLDHNIEKEFTKTYMVNSPGLGFQPCPPLEEGYLTPQRLGNLVIHTYVDDITNVKVDAVVSSSNKNLDMSVGEISRRILDKSNKDFVQQLYQKKEEIGKSSFVMTNKGHDKMGCHTVIHMNVWSLRNSAEPVKEFENCLYGILTKADSARISTVAFPPLGTGTSGIFGSVSDFCRSVFRALERTRKMKMKYLREVHLVVYDVDSLRKIHECLRGRFLGSGDIWIPTPQGVTEYPYIIYGKNVIMIGMTEEAVNSSIKQNKM